MSGFERVETEKNGLGEITGEPGQTIGENRRQVENTEVLQLSDASGYLHIPLDGSYVSQFLYHYDYDGLLNAPSASVTATSTASSGSTTQRWSWTATAGC